MNRAAIIIGVNKVGGGMPLLGDAAAGARRFEEWALWQGFETVKTFTDENNGAVSTWEIILALREIVEQRTTSQLIIYFAGHGFNIGYGEYWLLSDALSNVQEAINVRGSAWQAAYSGIKHTLFISDACRTAPDVAVAQRLQGSLIFPNEEVTDLEKPVDLFYACTLGRPAMEVRNPRDAPRRFSSIYTDVLLEGLRGNVPALLEKLSTENNRYVRPRKLKTYLTETVPQRLADMDLTVIQVPDAHVSSDDNAWIARIPGGRRGAPEAEITQTKGRSAGDTAKLQKARTASDLLKSVLSGKSEMLDSIISQPTKGRSSYTLEEACMDMVIGEQAASRRLEKGISCGFTVRGSRIRAAFSNWEVAESVVTQQGVVSVLRLPEHGTNVLLELENGTGILLPAIPGFIATLNVTNGEVVDVAYDPAAGTPRWQRYQSIQMELRALRALAASSTGDGVFRLEGEDPEELARRMQYMKGADPSLAVYAAYAYHDLQRRDLIQEMENYLHDDIGIYLFDVTFLSRGPNAKGGRGDRGSKTEAESLRRDGKKPLLPAFPLLSQGWSLLTATGDGRPPSFADIDTHLIPSVWSLFDRTGVGKLKDALVRGEIR